jgi:hypothetical protein
MVDPVIDQSQTFCISSKNKYSLCMISSHLNTSGFSSMTIRTRTIPASGSTIKLYDRQKSFWSTCRRQNVSHFVLIMIKLFYMIVNTTYFEPKQGFWRKAEIIFGLPQNFVYYFRWCHDWTQNECSYATITDLSLITSSCSHVKTFLFSVVLVLQQSV